MLPGMHGLPLGVDAQPRGEQHHVGVGAEDRARGPGAGDTAAHRRVKALHADGIGEVFLDRTVDARQGVVEAGQPAVVLDQQLLEERRALIGRSADQFGPGRRRARAAGHDRLAVADFEHAAEEIEHVRVGLEPGMAMPLRNSSAVSVELRQSQIEPAQRGIAEERVDEIAVLLFFGGKPVIGAVKHGDRRTDGNRSVNGRLVRSACSSSASGKPESVVRKARVALTVSSTTSLPQPPRMR